MAGEGGTRVASAAGITVARIAAASPTAAARPAGGSSSGRADLRGGEIDVGDRSSDRPKGRRARERRRPPRRAPFPRRRSRPLDEDDSLSLLPQPNGILQVVTIPVTLERPRREILGTLSAGFLLDDALAAQLKKITGSDVAFGMDGQILAATLPREWYPSLAERLRSTGISRLQLGNEEYEALPRPLAAAGDRDPAASGPVALILRSRTEQLQSLQAIHTGLAVTAVLAVVLATLLSFAVARTIAQPLAAITDVMRDVAATGDLTRKIALRHGNRWDDDDARLLATTFNTLTDSIARFQREMSQKERLTSLGRLSTVIAQRVHATSNT